LLCQRFQIFKEGKSLADVVIELDLDSNDVWGYYYDYLDSTNRKHLINIYLELKNDFSLFLYLFLRIKKEGLNKQDITELLENQNKLGDLAKMVGLFNQHLKELRSDKLQLEKEIMEKENLLYR
jgi:hypothetical protein